MKGIKAAQCPRWDSYGNFDEALKSMKALAYIMPGNTDLFCTADDNQ